MNQILLGLISMVVLHMHQRAFRICFINFLQIYNLLLLKYVFRRLLHFELFFFWFLFFFVWLFVYYRLWVSFFRFYIFTHLSLDWNFFLNKILVANLSDIMRFLTFAWFILEKFVVYSICCNTLFGHERFVFGCKVLMKAYHHVFEFSIIDSLIIILIKLLNEIFPFFRLYSSLWCNRIAHCRLNQVYGYTSYML